MNLQKGDEVLMKYWTYDIHMSREQNDIRFMYVNCIGEIVLEEGGKFIIKFAGQHTISFTDTSMLRKIV